MRVSAVSLMCAALLWGTFFLKATAPIMLGLLFSAMVFYWSLIRGYRLDAIGLVLVLNMILWLGSGLVVGSLGLSSFASPGFYNGDGRILLSCLPLLALAVAPVTTWELQQFIRQLQWVVVVSIAVYLFWLITGNRSLAGAGHADEFHAFFTSHTGSGTFFGCIAVFAIVFNAERIKRGQLLFAFLLLGPVFSSGSREGLVGVMAALGWFLFAKRKNPLILLPILLLALALVPAVEMMSNKAYNRTLGMFSQESLAGMTGQVEAGIKSDWAVGDWNPEESNDKLETGDVTTLVRMMLWVYAGKRFVDSPIVGMGWGRFNDRQLTLIDTPLLGIAFDGRRVFNTASAHNSYFHILAESGLLGMGLYLALWIALFFRARKAETLFKPLQSVRAYFVACQALVVYLLACALTGHALAAPSVMVPVVTILGVGAAYYRTAVAIGPPSADNPQEHTHDPKPIG